MGKNTKNVVLQSLEEMKYFLLGTVLVLVALTVIPFLAHN